MLLKTSTNIFWINLTIPPTQIDLGGEDIDFSGNNFVYIKDL